jgi:hypothetical protein
VVSVEDAARNNAELCHLVCGGGTFAPDAWTSPVRTRDLYPDAVTLVRGVEPEGLLARVDASVGCSIKDSFADLELAPYGFRVLFEAEWIHGPEPIVGEGLHVGAGDPELLPVGDDRWSALLNRNATCVGLSNVATAEGADEDATWAYAIRAAAGWCPTLPIVGYERDDDLAVARRQGFTTIGPLRVWIR